MSTEIDKPSSSSKNLELKEASPADSQELGQFFTSIPIESGALSLKIHRHVDFFSLYRRLCQNFKTFLLQDHQGQVLGTASFLFQNKLCATQPTNISFACDLRISSQRKAITGWAQHFLPQVEKLLEQEKLSHIVTTLNLTEHQAINAFLRPKMKRTHRPVYELLQKFNLVTVHGFYPFLFQRNKNIQTERFQTNDKEALINYMTEKLKKLELVDSNYFESLDKAIHSSLIYKWSDFMVAKDAQGKIVGCCHPLSSMLLQDYFPQSYNNQAYNFRQYLKLASWLGFARKLTRPFSKTNKEQTLNFKLLHFFFFEHPDVMNELLHSIYKNCTENEFLMYAYHLENFKMRPPLGAVRTQIPYALYEIRPDRKDFISLRSKLERPVSLDGLWF